MHRIETNTDVAQTHKNALRDRSHVLNRIIIPTEVSHNQQTFLMTSSIARTTNSMFADYIRILRRSADQIIDIHTRRVQEDEMASRQMLQTSGVFNK